MKKSIPKVRERESEASILGNDREREFPLTPVVDMDMMDMVKKPLLVLVARRRRRNLALIYNR